MRPHRFALTLITLVASLLFIAPLMKSEVFTFRDHSDYFQPLRYHTALSLQQGRLPLWNPYSASGEPWLANPQTAVFYPPAWLFVVLPFETAYMLFLLAHLLILGWGAYALFLKFAPPGPAMIGAMALMLSGPTLSLLDISNNLATFAWLPLVMWCAMERRESAGTAKMNGAPASTGESPAGAGAPWILARTTRFAALVLALSFLGGEPFFALLGAIAFALIVRRVREVAIAGAGAAGLAAIQIVPFLEFAAGSDRSGGLRDADILRESVSLRDWLRLGVPPRLSAEAFDPALSQHFIPMVYVGAIVVALAGAGLIGAMRGKASRAVVIAALIVLGISMIVSAGAHLPPVAAALTSGPLTLFRYPARWIPIGSFAVIAMAVAGMASLRIRRRWIDLVILLAVIADLVPRAAPLLRTGAWSTAVVPYDAAVGRTGKIIRLADDRHAAAFDRRAWISGYMNLYERRFDAWTAAPLANRRYVQLYERAVGGPRLDLLDFLPVAWVLADRSLPPRFAANGKAGAVTAHQNLAALPLATFWSRAEVMPDGDAALRSVLEGGNARRLVVSPSAGSGLEHALSMIGGVETVVVTGTFASVTVSAQRDGVVVLSQQDAPGWNVMVDGKKRTKLLAHGMFRAVEVTAGRHEILWWYRPRSLIAGAAITIAAILWMIFFETRLMHLKRFVKR